MPSLPPFLALLCSRDQGTGSSPDTAAFLMVLLRPNPGEGDLRPNWCGTGLSLPGRLHCGNHEIALQLRYQPQCTKLHEGFAPPPPPRLDLHPEQLDWSLGAGLFAVEGSAEVGCGEFSAPGGAGGAYGSVSILDDSAVLSRSQTETTSTHTHAGGLGKWKITSRMDWGVFASCYSSSFFFFYYLLTNFICCSIVLVATKGNASLPLL